MTTISPHPNVPQTAVAQDQTLRKVAQDLEGSFLSEMLKSAGLGKTSSPFSGGTGEDQFASFLVDEQAKMLVEAGGLGLAESIFNALKENSRAK